MKMKDRYLSALKILRSPEVQKKLQGLEIADDIDDYVFWLEIQPINDLTKSIDRLQKSFSSYITTTGQGDLDEKNKEN